MERNYREVPYSVRYGADFRHSVPVKGKDMDQEEPKAGPRMVGFVSDTKSNQEDYPLTDAGNPLSAVRGPRKRKECYEVDGSACDTMMYDRKRMRHISLPGSRSKEALKPPKGGSFKIDTGGGEKKVGGSKHLPSSGCSRATFHRYDGLLKSERVLHLDSVASEPSIASSDDGKKSGGNTSTLTSNEDGDSRLMTFSQVPKVMASNRFARYAVPSKDDSFTGVLREDVTGARHVSSSGHQSSRWKQSRKSADCEVISGPPQKNLSLYSGRECELNRVFGVGLWNSRYEKSIDERHNASASARDSGYSHEAGSESSSRDIGPDVRSSKFKQPCVEYGLSNSSREHQSSSVVTDFCASSNSVSLRLEGGSSLKPYHRFKAGGLPNMSSGTKSDDKVNVNEKAIRLTCVREEKHATSRSQYTSSMSDSPHPASISSEREPIAPTRYISIGRDESSSGSGSGGSESTKPEPTFVLSSGRLSKTQEAQLGKRPTTIDDDFDEYFAQLML